MLRVLTFVLVVAASVPSAHAESCPKPSEPLDAGALKVYCDLWAEDFKVRKTLVAKEQQALSWCAYRSMTGRVVIDGPDGQSFALKIKTEKDIKYVLERFGACNNYE